LVEAQAAVGAIRQLALVETYTDPGTQIIKVRDSFRITPSSGAVYYTGVDLGFPEVRASVQDNPESDGTYDETRYLGARAVSIDGLVVNNAFGDAPRLNGWDPSIGWNYASWWTRRLSSWASPAKRSRLYFTDDSQASRFIDVRGDSFTGPIDKSSERARPFQLGLVNPSGKIYSYDTSETATQDGRTRVLIRQSGIGVAGRVYPEAAPYQRTYPATAAGGTFVRYTGSVSNGFIANVYTLGQTMTGPRLTVTSPDGAVQSIGITGVTVGANYMITFNTMDRTITMKPVNSNTVSSLDAYKTAPLQWPVLRPGMGTSGQSGHNAVALSLASGSTDAYVEVIYHAADLF
jgi:hypothetical protein